MTRLQGGARGLSDSGHGPIRGDRTTFHFSKLPTGAPDVISRNTIIVSDSTRILSWNKEERQRNFNILVKRYKNQLLHGCQDFTCTTPTCLSFRRRVAEAPFRNFTELSARTLACYLASQDDPESGLCRNTPAVSSESLAQENGSWTCEWPPWSAGIDKVSREYGQHDRKPRSRELSSGSRKIPKQGNEDWSREYAHTSASSEHSRELHLQFQQAAPHREAPPPQKLKDPKSIAQNLFDTLSLRMVEWLPLRKAAGVYRSWSFAEEDATPSKNLCKNSHGIDAEAVEKRIPVTRKASKSGDPHCRKPNITSTPLNAPPATLEVKVPGQTVKRLSLGEIDHRKQHFKHLEDVPRTERQPSRKFSTNNTSTPTSRPIPSPPTVKTRPQKHRSRSYQSRIQRELKEYENRFRPHKPRYVADSHCIWLNDLSSPSEPMTPAGNQPQDRRQRRQSQLDLDQEPQVESLATLSEGVVSALKQMMFKTKEDEDAWKDEMTQLELRGYTEPWNWEFATPRQRQTFPFVAQSLFYVLSNPEQLIRSFQFLLEKARPGTDSVTAIYNEVQNIDDVFRNIHQICPWDTTLNSLWVCMGQLFVPPKDFSTSTKRHKRFIWRSTSNSSVSPDSEGSQSGTSALQDYVSDSHAACITVVVLSALSTSIPQLDSKSWQLLRRVRSAGTVLPDHEIRKASQAASRLLTEAADRFEHDLALRLMSRLARVISARLAFYEISKLKSSYIHGIRRPERPNPLDLIINCIQHYITANPGHPPPMPLVLEVERQTTMPMVAVEWLKSLLLKEWDGKPELLKSSAAGGALQLLTSMHHHRTKLNLIPEDFHTYFLFERLDPMEMPVEWLGFVPNNRTVHLLSCSFLFPPPCLVTYFRALNYSAMSRSYEAAMTASRHVTQTAFSSSIAIDDDINLLARLKTSISTYLVLVVRRDNALMDALDQLWRREKRELTRPLRVQMGMDEGEEGIDHGGVQQEFFRVVMAEAMNPEYGMFTADNEKRVSWFQPCSFEPLYKFELLGLLMSLAVYNGLTLPVNFPIAFYMKLLDRKVKKLDHIQDGWEALGKGLGELLSWNDGDVGDIFLRTYEFSFNAFGKVVTVDMTSVDRNEPWPPAERNVTWNKTRFSASAESSESGNAESMDSADNYISMLHDNITVDNWNRRDGHLSSILKGSSSKPRERCIPSLPEHEAPLVTNVNREQYVKDYIFWLTDKSVRPQYEAFARGFYTCLDRTALSIFTPEALKKVIEGIQEIDVDELEQYTRYDGFEPQDQLMKDFWAVVRSYSQKKRGQLLEFVTASARVPVNGISSILFVIMKNGTGDERLPTSSTCFGRLLLPEYSCREVLEEKLDKALENSQGFGVA